MLLNEIDNLITETAVTDIGKGFVRSFNPFTKPRHSAGQLIDRAGKYLAKSVSQTAVNPKRNRELFKRVNNQSIGNAAGKALMGLGGLGALSIGTNAAIKGAYDKYNPIINPIINTNSSTILPTSQKIISNIPKLIKT
jgi:hypothetical protein